jgi:RNA polymerase sigma factor for flagellar operon FliA
MEQGPTGDGEGSSVLRFISDDEDEWPSALLEQSELRRVVAELITRLPEVERTIITLYYTKEFTLREIAKVVDLHETRVSQLKSQAILRLRSAMHMKWPR